jgi:DNA polymerase
VVGLKVPGNFLFYLSCHEDCTERLLARAGGFTARELEILPDPEAVRLRKMVNTVRLEIHRMKGLVRLKPLGDRLLYGYLKPRHRIGGYVCDSFARRNPQIIVVLGNESESWISLFRNCEVLRWKGIGLKETLEEIQPALSGAKVQEDIEAVWKVYYQSQYCPERRNIAAFRRRMPKKALASVKLQTEMNDNGVTLDDFFGKE